MKLFIVTTALLASAIALPLTAEEQAAARAEPPRTFIYNQDELGQFDLEYSTAEGTVFKQHAHLVENENGTKVMTIDGEVTYIGDDGKTYTTKYHSDLDGTKMEGSHIPVGPEIPEDIMAQMIEADTVDPEDENNEAITNAPIIVTKEKLPAVILEKSETYEYKPEVLTIPDGRFHIVQIHIPKEMMRFPEMLQVVPLFLQQINQ